MKHTLKAITAPTSSLQSTFRVGAIAGNIAVLVWMEHKVGA
ncbi:MAG: hypothetical protein V7K48_16300 [Nostoc sp.]